MSHADKEDKLLIKPTAGARPASPCTPGRFIRKARDTRPDARRVTSSTDDTTLATALTDRPNESHRRLSARRAMSLRRSGGLYTAGIPQHVERPCPTTL